MKIRKLTRDDVEVTMDVSFEDLPVRGNVVVSEDPEFDKQCEDEIIERLDQGDIWAWCLVRVTVSWRSFKAHSYLGGCSYKDEDDFKADSYYEDLIDEAIDELNTEIEATVKDLQGVVSA